MTVQELIDKLNNCPSGSLLSVEDFELVDYDVVEVERNEDLPNIVTIIIREV